MNIDFPSSGQIPQLKALWEAAFGDGEEFLTPFFSIAFAPERCRCITAGGTVAAALYWFDCYRDDQHFAYVYAVATHPDFRHRGLCARLMADVKDLLASQGYDGILLYPASEALSRMYEKLGYHRCTAVSEFTCTAASVPIRLKKIGKDQYARLRRQYLPAGGVVQEGPLLDFLAEQVELYAGEDFVAAVTVDSDEIHCHELLGNTAAAPGILCAMGAQKGHFRTPGSEKPFAMALFLSPTASDPTYFGLPLD